MSTINSSSILLLSHQHVEKLKALEYPHILNNIVTYSNILLPLSAFFNFLTLYAIYAKTHRAIVTVRKYLIWHQLCIMFNSIWISGLVQPATFYPFFIVITNGPLNLFLSAIVQTSVLIAFLHGTAWSIITTLFYRCQTVLPIGHIFKCKNEEHIHTVSGIIFSIATLNGFFSVYALKTNIKEERAVITKMYPFLKVVMDHSHIFARRHDTAILYFTLNILISFSLCIVIAILVIFVSSKITNNNATSAKTKKLQKRFTNTLICQLIMPVWLLGVPGLYMATIITAEVYTRFSGIFNMGVILAASVHPVISSITTLFFWKCYRQFLFTLIIYPVKRAITKPFWKMSIVHIMKSSNRIFYVKHGTVT